jgi:hypothetical protein
VDRRRPAGARAHHRPRLRRWALSLTSSTWRQVQRSRWRSGRRRPEESDGATDRRFCHRA